MKFKHITLSLLAAILLFSVISCKKKKDDATPAKTCVISGYTDSFSNANMVIYTFDLSGSKIQKITSNQAIKTFSYNGNTIVVTTTDTAHMPMQVDSVILNGKGMVDATFTRYGANPAYSQYKMAYNANDQLTTVTRITGAGNPTDSTTYEWTNGDMTKQSNRVSGTISYEYDLNHAFADGDALSFAQYGQYGALYIKNAHVAKSRVHSYNNVTYYYYYTFNSTTITSVSQTMKAPGDPDESFMDKMVYRYLCQ